MITLSKSGSTVTFTFDENSGYLQNGTIDVPVNSLSLVIDDSDMATFRKSASNDIFVSARYADFGMTKAELEAWYKANMVSSGGGGGGGVTPEEVQGMIDEAVSGKADTTAVTADISAAVSGKQDTLVSGTNIKTINNESLLGSGNIDIQGGGKAIEAGRGISITTGATADTVSFNLPISAGTGTDSIIAGRIGNTATKSYSIALGSYNTASGDSSIAVNDYNVAGGQWSFAAGEATKAYGSASATFGYNTTARGDRSFAAGSYVEVKNKYEFGCGKYNVSRTGGTEADKTLFTVGNGTGVGENAYNAFEIRQNDDIYILKDNSYIKLQDNLGVTPSSAITSGDTNAVAGGAVYSKFDEVEQVTARALIDVNDKFGGLKLEKLTQAQYDALSGSTDSNTLYVIVN